MCVNAGTRKKEKGNESIVAVGEVGMNQKRGGERGGTRESIMIQKEENGVGLSSARCKIR